MKRLYFLGCALLGAFMLGSCSNNNNTASSTESSTEETKYPIAIEDNLSSYEVIDDNYRNYYEIFVRSFRDSNNDGIGDLNGVTEKLDYIRDLGYTGIWLMPINPSPSYHKYDVKDYYSVDSQYGSIDDLKRLIAECHKRDIKLILDLVLNHSSDQHPDFQKAINAYQKFIRHASMTEEDMKYKDYYTFYEHKEDIPKGVKAYKPYGRTFYYEGNFSDHMPEYNCDSEAVRAEFKRIIKYYLDMGVDGFRLDAIKYFYYENTPKNVEFLSLINKWTKEINPKAYIVGECFDVYETIKDYYKSGIDSVFNFQTSVNNPSSGVLGGINLQGKALKDYYKELVSNSLIVGDTNGIPAPFLDNHDLPRFTTSQPMRVKYQYACLQMLNGTTFTYYGDEIGMIGSNRAGNPDQNVRIPILWGENGSKGDCSVIDGVSEIKYKFESVLDQEADPNSILNFYKQVLRVRNQNPEIARGKIELIEMENKVNRILFISKEYKGSKIGIIFNFDPFNTLTVDYKKHGFNEVVGQIKADANSNIMLQEDQTIVMPSYSIAIVK